MKIYVIAACALVFAGGVATYLSQARNSIVDWTGQADVTVTLTAKGYSPSKIYISRGTTVHFVSEVAHSFWPASDVHPSHTVYPEFDPKRALRSDESWSHVFDKDGRWSYHDHLDSVKMGSIIVVPPGITPDLEYAAVLECGVPEPGAPRGCWKELIESSLDDRGLDGAFEEIHRIFTLHKDFSRHCHSYVHQLGVLAYGRYSDKVPLTQDMATCAHGFWHGYMEAYIREHDGDVGKAKQFCDSLDDADGGHWKHSVEQCYHGIGHGKMEYIYGMRPDLVTDLKSILTLGVTDCSLFTTEDDRIRCSSGVVAVTLSWIHLQGLQDRYMSLNDIFALCAYFSDGWAIRGCALELATPALDLAKYDPDKAFAAVISSGRRLDAAYMPTLVAHTALRYGATHVMSSDAELAEVCNSVVDPDVHSMCAKGLVGGLLSNGEPGGREYERVVRYCDSLSERDDREECGFVVVHHMTQSYGAEGTAIACSALQERSISARNCEN